MKLTNRQILDGLVGLRALSKVKLPVRTAYAVAKASKKLTDALKPIEEVQTKLHEAYAEKDESGQIKITNGNQLQIKAESLKDYNNGWNELMDQTNEVSGLRLLKFDEFADIVIEPEVLMTIEWLLDEVPTATPVKA